MKSRRVCEFLGFGGRGPFFLSCRLPAETPVKNISNPYFRQIFSTTTALFEDGRNGSIIGLLCPEFSNTRFPNPPLGWGGPLRFWARKSVFHKLWARKSGLSFQSKNGNVSLGTDFSMLKSSPDTSPNSYFFGCACGGLLQSL